MNLSAADTCELDAPATQAHTAHTEAHRRVDGGGPQQPSHTGQAYEAPRPASGPDTSGTAQPANSRLAHHLEEAGLDALEDLVLGHLGGGLTAQVGHLRNAGEEGVGGGAVGVAHMDIKHHPVTDVNTFSRHSLGTFADTCALFAGGPVSHPVGDNGARLVGVEG